jgi:hypothetical protein
MIPAGGIEADRIQPSALLDIALDAYTYAYPLIAMDTLRRIGTSVMQADCEHGRGAPINQFTHLRRLPDASSMEKRPSIDTLRSSLWFDVSREPLVVTLPDWGGRFYSLSLLDAWSDAFACLGTRSTGTEAQRFAIVGPRWRRSLPRGIRVYRSPTATGWLLCNIEVRGAQDLPHLARAQASLSAAPWSQWARIFNPPAGAAELLPSAADAVRAVCSLRAEHFFTRFCALTRHDPPHAHDQAVLDRLRSIGLVPGRRLDYAGLSAAVRAALEQAVLVAPIRLQAAHARLRSRSNAWYLVGKPYAAYGTDYATRAAVAFGDLGSCVGDDVLTFSARQETTGDAFDSARRYTLRFGRGQLPPTQGFWSLTLYDDRRRLVDSELGRHNLGSRDGSMPGPDGSLTLLVQRDRPTASLVRNWLPAPPSGGFSLSLRLYAPLAAARDGIWTPPPLRRAEALSTQVSIRPTLLRLERPGA